MDKPFKTIAEQAEILSGRGLVISKDTERILEREGYYPVINGYKRPFIDKKASKAAKDDRYIEGASFDQIYRLFEFDRDLRMTLFAYIAKAEATFKTACSYNFSRANQDKGDAYLDASRYSSDQSKEESIAELIKDFKKIIDGTEDKNGNKKYQRQYIEHYALNHDHVPIWVLANFLMLGQIFKFYCFQPESLRNSIAKTFSDLYQETHDVPRRISPRKLQLVFNHIKDFRNICAHDERLYCARVSPSKDVCFADVLEDLSLVLTKLDYVTMMQKIISLMYDILNDIGPIYSSRVFNAMGVDLSKLFAAAQ